MALRVTTAATIDPVTLAEAKTHLRIVHDDENSYITNLITAATTQAQSLTHRQFINASYTLELAEFPAEFELDRPPLSSVTSVKYYDAANAQQTLTADTDYEVDAYSEPGRILLVTGESWPTVYDRALPVTVVYVAGYGATAATVPMPIRQAILGLVGHYYENRELSTVVKLEVVPEFIDALLGPYIWPSVP